MLDTTDELLDGTPADDVQPQDTREAVADPPTPDPEPLPDDAGLSRRDVRYREQLRAVEAERDTLRSTVEAMQRSEVERLAAEHLTKPAALWTIGTELATLLDEDGTVNPELVRAAAVDARQLHGLEDPLATKRNGPVVPREGGIVRSGGHQNSSWTTAFKQE